MAGYTYLLWDIDGTILDFEAAESAAIKALFIRFGFGVCTDDMIKTYSAINKKYWEALERGEMTKPYILTARFREFFTQFGIDPDKADAFNRDYQSALGDTIVFHDDALNVLKALKADYKLIAVTNGTETAQNKKLSCSGLDRVFDRIFISEKIGIEKPNKGFFDVVFKTCGITDPACALIIGDSLTSDILGGINAGIDTCLYDPRNKHADAAIRPTYRISDLREVARVARGTL